jgi:hypothetical protein
MSVPSRALTCFLSLPVLRSRSRESTLRPQSVCEILNVHPTYGGANRFCFAVDISAPLVGLIVVCRGTLEPAGRTQLPSICRWLWEAGSGEARLA